MRPFLAGLLLCACLVPVAGLAQTPTSPPPGPGKTWPWVFNHIPDVVSSQRVTAAELKAVEANFLKLIEIFNSAPMLSPPIGFDIRFTGTLGGPDPDYAARITALPYWLEFAFMDYLFDKTGRVRTGTFPHHGFDLFINDPDKLMTGSTVPIKSFDQRWWKDKDGAYWIEPPSDQFHGLPFYRIHDMIVIARGGTPLWNPVTVGRYLVQYLAERKKAASSADDHLESLRRAYRDVTSPEAEARHQKEIDAARASKNAEQEVRRLETIRRRRIEDARAEMTLNQANPRHQWYFAPKQAWADAEALSASLDETGRRAPACITGNVLFAQSSEYKLVPDGSPGCHRLVEPNPGIFDGRLPRTAIQLIIVKGLARCESTMMGPDAAERAFPGGCPGAVKLGSQLDWQKLAALVGK
jgi:hypothetical protein